MKLRVFGWLVVGSLLYVCPSAMSQTLIKVPIVGSQTTDATIAGVATGGAPWNGTGQCTVSSAGDVDCKITDLVVPGVTPGNAGVTGVGASLVCNGVVAGTTAMATLSDDGKAKIKGSITLPSSCPAPIILIQVLEANGNPVAAGTVFIGLSGFNVSSSSTDTEPMDSPPQR